ncbi:DMT family transporter [Aliarcobacter vitoriensis]|uniref:EamA family transporter n=1 Tax=Aliarcobacter vitoriensis TaxID=2011099 RepID=A0A366MR54_9BACT|nr:DMT family transporter [Aliarcobacter vitoriensis]RBQ28080.1 EamA family transporter [Aliarcobacter vitoriensis]
MSETFKAHILATIATILIAGSFLASQKLANVIDPTSLTLFRFVLALLFLSPIIIFNKARLIKVFQILPKALIVSLVYTLYFIGMLKALEDTTVLNTATIYTLVPLMTAILCIFFFKEKIPLKQLFIYILGIISTCIVVFKADFGLFLTLSLNKGDIVFLIASFSMALYPIFIKILYSKKDELLVLVFATLLGGIVWMSLTMQILNIPYDWNKIELNHFYSLLYLVIGTTIITLFLYQKATLILGPKKLMAYIYLNPAIVAVIMFLFEGQTITLGVLAGILLSVIATIIILRQR